MGHSGSHPEPATLVVIRRILIVTLVAGILGIGAELLLIGHFESAAQLAPLVLLPGALAVAAWHVRAQAAASVRALQLVMAAFVCSGAIGVGLHYTGNSEFEREMYPSLSGLALVGGALTGATPVLAPGSMALLGLVGLAYTYRHPRLYPARDSSTTGEEFK